MKKRTIGALVATVAAGLILSGQVIAEEKAAPAKVKCSGVNSCKGSGACKSVTNDCKGKNACKGKGWMEVGSDKDCTGKGGKVEK